MVWSYTWAPQGSILGPLLSNIFLADLLLVLEDADIANFADDNTPVTSANNIDDLIDSPEKASSSLSKWFKDNLFKGNPDKCYLLVSTNEKPKINIGEFSIENSDCEKVLRVKIDNKLTFDCHVSDMYKKANKKKTNFMVPFFMDGVQLPQGYSHFEDAVYSLSKWDQPKSFL